MNHFTPPAASSAAETLPYSTFLTAISSLPPSASCSFVAGLTLRHLQSSLRDFASFVSKTVPDERSWADLALVERRSSAGGKGRSYQVVLLNALTATTEGIKLGRVTSAEDVKGHKEGFERFAVRFFPPLFLTPYIERFSS
jgi:hypothetical protein